jgi:penicillin-binding protein 1A
MKASNRWSVLKSADKSDEEIIKSFSVKQNDRIYMERRKGHYYDSMDSIRYYHFLQSGLMAMEPQTGNIKAWVGGIDYKYFQYDHVGQAQDKWALHLNLCLRYGD